MIEPETVQRWDARPLTTLVYIMIALHSSQQCSEWNISPKVLPVPK